MLDFDSEYRAVPPEEPLATMQYLPIFADVADRACLIVGGGRVAERRVRQLVGARARVTVIAPEITRELAAFAREGRIVHRPDAFGDQPLTDYWLVVAATDDIEVNRRVAAAAAAAKRLCNVVDERELSSFIMPTIIDHDPVTIAVSSGGTSPVVARWIKRVIETSIPSRVGALARLAGRWRERVKQALPDLDQRVRFWESVVTGDVAEHAFAGRDEQSERALEAALARWHAEQPSGRSIGEAYLVGAGPGDPELITMRGLRLLATADAVLYDRLANPKILDYARREAEIICVGKVPGKPSIKQVQLNRLLVRLVASGKRVCRLKGGDPMIFGRAGEELEALTEAGLPFQIVPGVSAVEGCAAYAGIPLTLRGRARTVLITTGHSEDVTAELGGYKAGVTLALYMAVAHLESVAAHLIGSGHPAETPAAIVENGTTESQRVIRSSLGELPGVREKYGLKSPALLLVGETVRLAERYRWFNPRLIDASGGVNPALAQVS